MKITFDGQHVMITGASGGLGRTITKTMYEAGAQITAVGRDLEKLRQLQKEVMSFDCPKFLINKLF